jgi:hypothetical protein
MATTSMTDEEFQKLLEHNDKHGEAPRVAHSKGHASAKRNVLKDFVHCLELCGKNLPSTKLLF